MPESHNPDECPLAVDVKRSVEELRSIAGQAHERSLEVEKKVLGLTAWVKGLLAAKAIVLAVLGYLLVDRDNTLRQLGRSLNENSQLLARHSAVLEAQGEAIRQILERMNAERRK